MKKILFFLILFSYLSTPVRADYTALQLYEMILKADKIVIGQVISLDSMSFEFRVDQSPTGHMGTLTIRRFVDWPCASRWANYRVGQPLLLFLGYRDGLFQALSAGNEGELPIRNDSVFINSLSLPLPPPPFLDISKDHYLFFDSDEYQIDQKRYFGYRLSLSDMIDAILFIRSCFGFERGNYKTPDLWMIKCAEELIEKAGSYNKIIRWVYGVVKEE